MPKTNPLSAVLAASLEVGSNIALSGRLSALDNGQLQFSSSQAKEMSQNPGKLSLYTGTEAVLRLSDQPHQQGLSSGVKVIVTELSNELISLSFLDGGSRPAQLCLQTLLPQQQVDISDVTNLTQDTQESNTLMDLQQQSMSLLDDLLRNFTRHMEEHLLSLSSRTKQATSGLNSHYEARNIVRKINSDMIEGFLSFVSEGFKNLRANDQNKETAGNQRFDADSLNLIAISDFEDTLAIDRMIKQGSDRHRVALESLVIRVASLMDVNAQEIKFPIHVSALCQKFKEVITGKGIPEAAMPDIYNFFSREFVYKLDSLYAPLNLWLAAKGIEPNLELEIENKGSLLGQPRKKTPRPVQPEETQDLSEAEHQFDNQPDNGLGESVATVSGSGHLDQLSRTLAAPMEQTATLEQQPSTLDQNSQDIYRSVLNALNLQRESKTQTSDHIANRQLVPALTQAQHKTKNIANEQSIIQALELLQRDTSTREEVRQGSSSRDYLLSHQQQIDGLIDISDLSFESASQLDLIDNLFDTISAEPRLTSEFKPALDELQIPLAKMALLEPQFFVDPSHPARAVVDKITTLAQSSNFPNRGLQAHIQTIVDTIVADYGSDSNVFEEALGQVEKLALQQDRVLARNLDRVVRSQEGQEKLRQAHRAVDELIHEQIPTDEFPQVLHQLFESGWRDVLVHTALREGTDSPEWQKHCDAIAQLTKTLATLRQDSPDPAETAQMALATKPVLAELRDEISIALPTSNRHEKIFLELTDTLAGRTPVSLIEPVDATFGSVPDPKVLRARINDLPRLKRWVQRVEELTEQTWLNYTDTLGEKRRMQLAWISPDKDRYVFVDERGQKTAVLSAIQLARQLSKGVHPPVPSEKLSIVDQSMYETLETVQKTLSFSRTHDPLTNLLNRESLEKNMEKALVHAQQKNTQHAIIYINIDQFALVNEVYDRINGDQVLLEFAQLLAQLDDKNTSSARLGSDEFVVLLLGRTADQAAEQAEKIRSDIENSSVDIDGESVSFTVSLGVAPLHEYSISVDAVMSAAESAMRQAKEAGRDTVRLYKEDKDKEKNYTQEKKNTQDDLEQALATDRFVLSAQPIVQSAVDGDPDRNFRYEVLLGLKSLDGELRSPQDFIESAERFGFMTLVDKWVVEEAFTWISHLMDTQKVVPHLSINLSGNSICDDEFLDYLFDKISEFGVGTNLICFELTETGTISSMVKAADFMRALRNIGCKFSLDDFGTGLASHNYLRDLPVDYVKIDGSFVSNIHKDRNDHAMTRSINDLAHFLGQKTVAESVENEEIVELLREMGVDYLQGWGIGKPKLLAEITAELPNLET